MRLPWRKKARLIEPRPIVGPKVQELQTAKEILAEVFHARPADVEEMIQRRLEEKNSPVEYEDVLWPSTFCLVDLNGPKLREHEDGRKGCLSQVAQGQHSSEERGPGLWAEACGDGSPLLSVRKAPRPGRLLQSVALGAPKYLSLGVPQSSLTRNSFGDICQNATRKIISTVVVGRISSGLIGAVSPSLIPVWLTGPLALQPSF